MRVREMIIYTYHFVFVHIFNVVIGNQKANVIALQNNIELRIKYMYDKKKSLYLYYI
jgi:hypothetical protein